MEGFGSLEGARASSRDSLCPCRSRAAAAVTPQAGRQVGLTPAREQGACTAGVGMFVPSPSILISPSATGDPYWIHGNGFSTLRFHQLVTMGCSSCWLRSCLPFAELRVAASGDPSDEIK